MSNNTSRVLTIDDLIKAGACRTYTSLFRERFPEGSVEMTVEMAVNQAEDWDWYFAAGAFLTDRTDWANKIEAAEEDYRKTVRPYREILSAMRVEAQKLFNGVDSHYDYTTDSYSPEYYAAEEEFNSMIRVPRAAFNAAQEAADKELHRAQARAFAESYIAEGPVKEETSDPTPAESTCWCGGNHD